MKQFFSFLFLFTVSASVRAQIDCNSWVKLDDRFAAVTVGDLDVTGNQVTVEALFLMTGPSVDIVSKHWGGFDLNYLLRPGRAEIATDISGFVTTNQGAALCNDQLVFNKIYHAALVYNGSTLKFYRNGALISTVNCVGNLITNNWNTAIGEHAPVVTPTVNGVPNPDYHNSNEWEGYYDESFRGYINEVKIWNVARTQQELRLYMYNPLPDPTTQPGLVGYWTLNNLQNLQGNATYNGSIEGLATIGQTNITCNFIRDSCNIVLPVKISNLNAYSLNEQITLSWQTQDELNIKDYVIQRSEKPDFSSYIVVGVINATGNSARQTYSFADEAIPASGNKTYYYRLQVKERSGGISYTNICSAKIERGSGLVASIYPNPVNGNLVNIRFNHPQSFVNITMQNSAGQTVRKMSSPVFGTAASVNIEELPKGTYLVNIVTGKESVVRKVIKL